MGTPSLVSRGDLIPNGQQYALCGKSELYRKPSRVALLHSVRSLTVPQRLLSTTRSLPRTRAFPDLPLSRDFVSWPSSPLRRRRDLRCRADAGQGFGSALNLTKTIQTDSLPPTVRDSTMKAIDELGRRVTNGDVASRAGLKVTQAESALQALAADSGGFLEVSDEGDVLYVFPKDYRSNLSKKSFRMKLEPVLEKIQAAAAYLVRISFGTALVASIVIVYSAILVLLSSSRGYNTQITMKTITNAWGCFYGYLFMNGGVGGDDDNRGNRGGYGNQRYNSGGMTFYVSPMDLFWFWDPYYNRRPRPAKKKPGMNFFESVFSFVFGDGDPNDSLEERRWKLIGDLLASKGGVVTTEELAPYLDVPPLTDEIENDESFVLPVLLRFDGYPEVDRKGNILYRFPSLQRTANDWTGQRKEVADESVYLAERRWNFSKASKPEQALVLGLGGLNLLGIIVLGGMLRDVNIVGQLSGTGLVPFAAKLLPWLQAYTASFFAIPAFRWFLLQKRNNEIEDRNRARIGWAVALQRANKELQEKLTSAREMAKRTFIGGDRIIYSTEKDFSEQSYEALEWDEQLKKSQSGKG